jgi:hypothetical protein
MNGGSRPLRSGVRTSTPSDERSGVKRLILRVLLCFVASSAAGCGGDDDEALSGSTPCEKWRSLSLKVGCGFEDDCSVESACSEQAITWMECTARDTAQCTCRMDMSLDCEGSHDPNAGPALCGPEFRAYNSCVVANM